MSIRPAAFCVWLLGLFFAQAAFGQTPSHQAASRAVILATTTSTQDSGLLDVLVPLFEGETGYQVKTIAVGTGQALAMGRRGDADVLLVHAPAEERRFMADGHGVERRPLMVNDFVLVGPARDPAKVSEASSAVESLQRIAAAGALFLSRGDDSGTHFLEQRLWREAGRQPAGIWYQQSGQGMGRTLMIASEKNAYTLTDRGTYLTLKRWLELSILLEGDPELINTYSVIQVNPGKSPRINRVGAEAFFDFMFSSKTLNRIKTYGLEKYGRPLFNLIEDGMSRAQ